MSRKAAAMPGPSVGEKGRSTKLGVTAYSAVTPSFVDLPFSPTLGPGMAAALRDIDDERRARARVAFEHSLTATAGKAAWAEVQDDPVIAAFAQQALYADLLVLGQHDPSSCLLYTSPSPRDGLLSR